MCKKTRERERQYTDWEGENATAINMAVYVGKFQEIYKNIPRISKFRKVTRTLF
jgi:hypothetical protein